MRLLLASLVLVLISACAARDSTRTPPVSTSSAATTATASVADLYERWAGEFDAVTNAFSGPVCASERVQGKGCAAYLTAIAEKSNDLEREVRSRPDATSYVDTPIETRKISNAGERYADLRCYEGGGSLTECQGEMIAITTGSVLVITKLKLDELRKK
jgi:hypothetical protein